MHALVEQISDLIEAGSDLLVRSCYTFPSLVSHLLSQIWFRPQNNIQVFDFRKNMLKFESIELSSGINFCDDIGAAVVTIIDNINADIKQVTNNIPIVFAIAQLIANQ